MTKEEQKKILELLINRRYQIENITEVQKRFLDMVSINDELDLIKDMIKKYKNENLQSFDNNCNFNYCPDCGRKLGSNNLKSFDYMNNGFMESDNGQTNNNQKSNSCNQKKTICNK